MSTRSPPNKMNSKAALPQGTTRVLLAVLACAAWMAVSSVLILLNKQVALEAILWDGSLMQRRLGAFHRTARFHACRYIMVDLHFKYPMTVSSMGMLSSGLLSFVCCRVIKIVPAETHVTFEFWMAKVCTGIYSSVRPSAHMSGHGGGMKQPKV